MDTLKLKTPDALLLALLAVLVLAYAYTQNAFVGILGLLALLALVGRDLLPAGGKEKKDRISIAGLQVRTRWMLVLALLLSVLVAVFAQDLIRLFAFLLALLNLAALFEKRLGLPELSSTAAELDTAFYSALFAWLALGLILHTDTPIDVVTSCSMLPNLERGDLIILQGGDIRAPQVNLTRDIRPTADFVKNTCVFKDKTSGAMLQTGCSTGLLVDGKEYPFDSAGDIIVYSPPAAPELGLIVHRVVLKTVQGGKTHYITKGDNNPVADLEGIITQLPSDQDVKGKMIVRIPYVGYLKLFLAFQFNEPAGCRRVLENP